MIPGNRYELTYQIPGVHRKPRIARMKYLGLHSRPGQTALAQFDLRPLAGTQEIDVDCIIDMQPTTKDLMLPRMVKS